MESEWLLATNLLATSSDKRIPQKCVGGRSVPQNSGMNIAFTLFLQRLVMNNRVKLMWGWVFDTQNRNTCGRLDVGIILVQVVIQTSRWLIRRVFCGMKTSMSHD